MRAQRLLEQRQPARLDHAALLAHVEARQSATPSAQTAGQTSCDDRPADHPEALIALLLAEPGSEKHAAGRAGCFNRAVAKRSVNRP